MRTQQEIVERIRGPYSRDFMGTQLNDLIARLDYEHAKEFLKPEYDGKDWKVVPSDDQHVREEAKGYVAFAWEKANGCRGLSAQRSLDHFRAWFWLLGDEDMMRALGETHVFYGKPQLVKISEKLGVDWRKLDNDRWHNYEGDDGMTAEEAMKEPDYDPRYDEDEDGYEPEEIAAEDPS